ncbi:hypothetical protein QUF49_15470 [Fictibacillus sp. b24]|uniref:hypothetical protein n=1 Tax=Fictibacillus sp. b24 TaxID=3055863 RepID=UPI0025A23397|nr:hypothetical protein [Fictibacillus sp. b24]MDM5317409.1 hypothetical protein [Fictibacillus sp. b24]
MKKKIFLAFILFIGFVSVLSIFSKETVPTSNEIPINEKSDTIVYSGENDFWKAAFSMKKSQNQLMLTHIASDNKLPQELTFTLSTAYEQSKKKVEIGTYKLSFKSFPNQFSVTFDGKSGIRTENQKLVLKITGKDHYQFFNLYKE